MKRQFPFVLITMLCCLATTWLTPAFGYSTDGSTLTRTVSQDTAPINSPITLNITFTNASQDSLRGFYYVEQIPTDFEITTLSVSINGQSINDYVLETGQEGDVSPNYTPRRWVLEIPPDFVHTNPIPGQSVVEIVYSVSSPDPVTYDLDNFSWIGHQANTNPAFGYSESADRQTITFVSTDTPISLSGSCTNGGFAIELTGVPGYRYVIEASTNLVDWAPAATNVAPFEFLEDTDSPLDCCFFRAYHLQP